MVRHIVMWKIRNIDNRAADAQTVKSALDSLKDKIELIMAWEVGLDFSQNEEASADIVLNSTFKNAEDLLAYQNHPEHINVVQIIRPLTMERRVVDYYI